MMAGWQSGTGTASSYIWGAGYGTYTMMGTPTGGLVSSADVPQAQYMRPQMRIAMHRSPPATGIGSFRRHWKYHTEPLRPMAMTSGTMGDPVVRQPAPLIIRRRPL